MKIFKLIKPNKAINKGIDQIELNKVQFGNQVLRQTQEFFLGF